MAIHYELSSFCVYLRDLELISTEILYGAFLGFLENTNSPNNPTH